MENPALTLDDLLADAKATALDQLHAASQLQLDRLHEQLTSAWRGDLERIFDDRLTDAAARIEAWHQNESGSRLALIATNARANARRDLAQQFAQSVRRLRQFESEEQWSHALLDATRGFCERAALFVVNGQALELRAARGIDVHTTSKIPLTSAPAFASAVESKDMVIAMRTSGELSEPIAALVGESQSHRSALFPLTTRNRVAAVLYADSDEAELEPSAIEMLCSVAAAVLEGVVSRARAVPGQLVKIVDTSAESRPPATWFELNREEQNLHLRAQRFARVQVAEMRLYKAQAVRNGRSDRNLYSHLKSEIDSGREAFRKDFQSASDSMVDYFHLELLRTLANDDVAILGPDYPGQMA